MLLHERPQRRDLLRVGERLQADHLLVHARGKVAIPVQHIRSATRHAGGKVAPRQAQYDHGATGHVFAGMVAHALHDRTDTRVAYAETLTRYTTDIGLAVRA